MTVISLKHIAKIEGHANLTIKIENGKVEKVDLGAVEGARYFEGLVKGRNFDEAHTITQRICGICSVSHTLAALEAIENGLGINVTEQTKQLRELMEIGAFLQSHSLHLYLLALPDYLGYPSAIEMAEKYKAEVLRGLSIKKLGNELDRVIGGRIMHPVSAKVGGFSKLPTQEDCDYLLKLLEKAKGDALKTVELFAGLEYPKFMRRTEYVSLKTDNLYPITHGTIMFSNGLEVTAEKYAQHLKETVMPYSTAKFSTFEKRSFYVGALARLNNNFDKLSKAALKCLETYNITIPSFNPYHNNFAQAIEIVHFVDRAIELLKDMKIEDQEPIPAKPRACRGIAIVEAPRGILIHDFTMDSKGTLQKANVVTPTAQNLKNIEDDIYKLLPTMLDTTEKHIVTEMERLIRAYDPCISCSAHFLKVKWDRT